ncbi:ankyrin repeat domain-containing protein [Escherichia coli]|uniref:ankyrin repeat domain-containing protein n=1 Tax=Escherichia TaxID=561 RepID=UPI000CF7A7B7|nr:ankyrin repeat domain-containing protein [Escherichia sp. MOD1-EC5189]EIY7827051.1 ankyrin repeat domain-containing protein [Escherichia coli]
MAKAKKKKLPKDFDEILQTGDFEAFKAVFESCDVNAYGGYGKEPALAKCWQCPESWAQWLVEQGADLTATDEYGATPLHNWAHCWTQNVDVLLKLGADVNAVSRHRGTALHSAAKSHKPENVRKLIQWGAQIDVLNAERHTPLEAALCVCRTINIEEMVQLAEILLAAGAERTPRMREFVTRIGEKFEFLRADYNPESVDKVSAALDRLYQIFDVEPVPRRYVHDGVSPIVINAQEENIFAALWQQLVPGIGAANSLQGEVIRIAGKIIYELDGNGGINWDADYKKMADAFLEYVSQGNALPEQLLEETRLLIALLKKKKGEPHRLVELSVIWVTANLQPIRLDNVKYKR